MCCHGKITFRTHNLSLYLLIPAIHCVDAGACKTWLRETQTKEDQLLHFTVGGSSIYSVLQLESKRYAMAPELHPPLSLDRYYSFLFLMTTYLEILNILVVVNMQRELWFPPIKPSSSYLAS